MLRHGQLGHGTLAAEPEPRLLEALQGLPVAEVAAGGWHSVCVSGEWLVLLRSSSGLVGSRSSSSSGWFWGAGSIARPRRIEETV